MPIGERAAALLEAAVAAGWPLLMRGSLPVASQHCVTWVTGFWTVVTGVCVENFQLTHASGRVCCRDVVDLDSIDRTSMACPALPTCGLAVTESERSLPDINTRIRALMSGLGFDDAESFVVRMTGAAPSACLLA